MNKKRAEFFAKKLKKYDDYNIIWAFVDKTFRGFYRFIYVQRFDYLEYKEYGLKFQGAVRSNDLIFSFDDSRLKFINDLIMFREFIIARKVQKFWLDEFENMRYLYEDQTYSIMHNVLSSIFDDYHNFIENKRIINNKMSSIRINIELIFDFTQQLWTANAFKFE